MEIHAKAFENGLKISNEIRETHDRHEATDVILKDLTEKIEILGAKPSGRSRM
jgi:hypothetical protein